MAMSMNDASKFTLEKTVKDVRNALKIMNENKYQKLSVKQLDEVLNNAAQLVSTLETEQWDKESVEKFVLAEVVAKS